MTSDNYVKVNINNISEAKLRKLMKTGKICFTANDLVGSNKIYLHPMNAKLLGKAIKNGKGCNNIKLTGGEINHNIINGGSIWSILKSLGSTIYKGLTSPEGKKILGSIADVVVPAGATFLGAPELAGVARSGLKELTGVGIKEKRLANLAKARLSKKNNQTGGSFKIGGSFVI